jgi:hypothetical protein
MIGVEQFSVGDCDLRVCVGAGRTNLNIWFSWVGFTVYKAYLVRYGDEKNNTVKGGSTASAHAIVHFGSVGRLCGLFERSKAT